MIKVYFRKYFLEFLMHTYTIEHGYFYGWSVITLKDEKTNSWLSVAPQRGAIVTSWGTNGEELLYLDVASFADGSKNVRGGIPLLFPISGQVKKAMWTWKGQALPMRNHGFARNLAWNIVDEKIDDEGAHLTLSLSSSEATRAEYPFEFEYRITYTLKDGKCLIDQTYINLGNEPMPVSPGFHPYFKADTKAVNVKTSATAFRDYNDMQVKTIENGIVDLTGKKESVSLLDVSHPSIDFNCSSGNRWIRMSTSKQFRVQVLWSVEKKPFVCVEPWFDFNEAFNRLDDDLVFVKNGEPLNVNVTYELL